MFHSSVFTGIGRVQYGVGVRYGGGLQVLVELVSLSETGCTVVGQRNHNRTCTASRGWQPRSSSSRVGLSLLLWPYLYTEGEPLTPYLWQLVGYHLLLLTQARPWVENHCRFGPNYSVLFLVPEQVQLRIQVQGWFESFRSKSSEHELNPVTGKSGRMKQIRELIFNHPTVVEHPPPSFICTQQPQ